MTTRMLDCSHLVELGTGKVGVPPASWIALRSIQAPRLAHGVAVGVNTLIGYFVLNEYKWKNGDRCTTLTGSKVPFQV